MSVSNKPQVSFLMPDNDVALRATWNPIPHTVTLADPDCNSVVGGPTFNPGDVVTIKCTSPEFVEWSCNDPTVVFANKTSPNTTFTMGIKDITIQHTFKSYEVTVAGSTTSVTGAGSYLKGDTVHLDAGTKAGYRFTGWTSSPAVTFANASSATTTFSMINSNVAVTANWELIKYAVTLTGTSGTPSGAGNYAPGESVTVYAGTKAGHVFDKWVVTKGTSPAGVNLNSDRITFTMGSGDLTLNATWIAQYQVTVQNSKTTGDGTGLHNQGSTVTIKADSNLFHHWEVTSGTVTLANAKSATTTFVMPGTPVTVKAVYNTEVFHTAIIDGVTSSHYVGEKVAIDAGTKAGYTFKNWTATPDVEFVDN